MGSTGAGAAASTFRCGSLVDCLAALPDAVAARRSSRIRGLGARNAHWLFRPRLRVGALVGGNRIDGILLGRAPAHEEGEETVGLLGQRLRVNFRIGLRMGRGIKLNGRFLFRAQNVLPALSSSVSSRRSRRRSRHSA